MLELFDRVSPVIPQIAVRVRGTDVPRIRIGDKLPSFRDRLSQDLLSFLVRVGTLGKVLVAIADSPLVPFPHADSVGIG